MLELDFSQIAATVKACNGNTDVVACAMNTGRYFMKFALWAFINASPPSAAYMHQQATGLDA